MSPIRWCQLGWLILLCGCSTGHLPKGAQLVGGGLSIRYIPPTDGTVILMERTSGKIITSGSVSSSGAPFEFGPTTTPNWEPLMISFFPEWNPSKGANDFLIPTNAFFELYFVPEKNP